MRIGTKNCLRLCTLDSSPRPPYLLRKRRFITETAVIGVFSLITRSRIAWSWDLDRIGNNGHQ
jgi:hypothetical protein